MFIANPELWNQQWLYPIGVLLSLLGPFYLAVDFLDKRYVSLRVLTQGITFGLVIASFYAFAYTLAFLLGFLVHSVLFTLFSLSHSGSIYLTYAPDILPNGLVDGCLLGVVYSLIRQHQKVNGVFVPQSTGWNVDKQQIISTHPLSFSLATGFLLLCCSFGTFYFAPPLYFAILSSNIDNKILLALVSGDLGGFLLGLIFAWIRASREKSLLAWLIMSTLFLLFIFLSITRTLVTEQFVTACSYLLYESSFGFVFGLALYKSLHPHAVSGNVSWLKFLLWLFLGNLIATLSYLLILRITYDNPIKISLESMVFQYVLLLAIFLSKGDQLIKKVKMRYRYVPRREKLENMYTLEQTSIDDVYTVQKAASRAKDELLQRAWRPLSNSKRLLFGFIVGVCYGIPFIFLSLLIDYQLHASVGYSIGTAIVSLTYSLQFGLIIGFVYGYGPRIVYMIENLPKRSFGQIGLALSLLGVFIVAIVH